MLSHSFVVLYMFALFSLMHLIGVFSYGYMVFELVNFPLYYLGLLLAGLLSYGSKAVKVQSDQKSFRWVRAIRQSNARTAVLALLLFAIILTTEDKEMSRLFIGSFIGSFLGIFWLTVIPINRYIPVWIAGFAFSGENSIRTIFLGSEKSARRLENWAKRQPFFGVDVLGLVTYELVTDSKLKMPIIGEFMELSEIIEGQKVDQVVLLETRNSDWWVDSVVDICEKTGSRILIFNPWEAYFDKMLIPVHQGGHTFFTLQQEPLENPLNRSAKRALDICISLPVVLFILPVLCLIVKIKHAQQSPGALFYRQDRSGRRGRKFSIFKFRSMHDNGVDRSREGEQAKEVDDRIFAFGKTMRRLSIDEFPQFLNVLKGDMSVIGPRPHLLQHDSEFSEQVNVYRSRHFVKPGITGLAQCQGFRGEITELSLIEQRVYYDLEYINQWSFWLDLWIIAKTFHVIIHPPKTAY
jgi:exopolysaccharide biosynthesis polyprenyl glycosylphosphotransferase